MVSPELICRLHLRDGIPSLAFDPAGRLLAADGAGSLYAVDVHGARARELAALDYRFCSALALSADGQRAAIGAPDGRVALLSAEDGAVLHQLQPHRLAATALAFSAEGDELISGSLDGTIRRVRTRDGKRAAPLLRLGSGVLALRAEGERRAAVDHRGLVCWRVGAEDQRQRHMARYGHGGGGPEGVAFDPASPALVYAQRAEPQLRVWRGGDLDQPPDRTVSWDEPAFGLARSSRGLLAIAHRDAIRLLDADDLRELAYFQAPNGTERHRCSVSSLVFSADGRWLAAADVIGTVSVWRLD